MIIRVLWPGKTKKPYYRDAIADYSSRIRKLTRFEIVEVREESTTDANRNRRIRSESKGLASRKRSATVVLLDPNGSMMSSEDFAGWLERLNTDVDFLVGGSSGVSLPDVSLRLSLGRITLPHELARVVILEQIYRALTIQHRIPYHK